MPETCIDTSAWSDEAKRLLRTGRDAAGVLKQEARLFMRDVIHLTPPTGKQPFSESFNVQRRAGEKAIANDIGGLFTDCQKLSIIKKSPRIGRDLARYASAGRLDAATTLLRRIGVKSTIILEATKELHAASRGYGGRVPKSSKRKYLVLRGASIKQLILEKQKLVGYEKAGWLKAALALGVSLPNWITRHSQSKGIFKDDTASEENPSLTMGNTLGYAQAHGARLQVIQRAYARRVESLKTRLAHIIAKNARS